MVEDFELAAFFDLNEPVERLPRTDELVALDKAFECSDFGLAESPSNRDEDVTEISIERGKVVRKYR
jgi:hypothetical protein